MQDVGEHQFLMLLLVIESDIHQRREPCQRGRIGFRQEFHHRRIDVLAIGRDLVGAGARYMTALGTGVPRSGSHVIGIEQKRVVRVKGLIAGAMRAEQELLDSRVALVRATRDVVIASYALAATAGRLTARDLNLPVPIYDPLEYYGSTRNRWFGTDVPPAR